MSSSVMASTGQASMHVEPTPHGPAHHDGGSLAGKDSLFDSSTRSRTGTGSAGLLIGRPSASSSWVTTVGGGRDAPSAFMSQRMARRGAWEGSCSDRLVGVLARPTPAASVRRHPVCPGARDSPCGALRQRPGASDTSMTGRPATRTRPSRHRAKELAAQRRATPRRSGRRRLGDLRLGRLNAHGALWPAGSVNASRPGRA
jgi:hypothetical protein